MLDKFSNKCLIDGVVIANKNGLAIAQLSKYLKNHHNITLKEYLIKYYYNGKHPLCSCGCGENTSYVKGRFGKYFGNHKNFVTVSPETRLKLSKSSAERQNIEYKLKRANKTKEEIIFAYNQFINFVTPLCELTQDLKLDKRTLKNFWKELNLIPNKYEFEKVCKTHQKIWQNKNNNAGGKQHLETDLLLDIYFFLKEHRGEYTLNEISHKFMLPVSGFVLFKRLSENFGETIIKEYLRSGISSKPENEYYNILKYFYGDKIQKGFQLEGKFYDYILGDNILIEFDGDYWHNQISNKENDKIKNAIAIKNGFIIFRIKESESANIDVLFKLNKIYETKTS